MEVTIESFKKRFTYDPQKDLLGKGGYSEVYKAYDTEDKIFVALKIYQGDLDSKYNLSNEIRKFKRLRHPNLIEHLETYDVTTGNNDIHGNPIKYQIGILEYANAGTLADLIKQGQLIGSANAAKLESIAKDIIAALEYLHSRNIIHRDLKPSNILMFKEGEKLIPKICDFGIAKVMDNATAVSTQLVGTVEYMAPEYFRTDLGDIGKASDLWSLGVILLEAASGQHPFGKASEGYSNGQIINNILNKEKINLDVIQDASILEIVKGLLNPNPQDRYCKNIGAERKYQSEPIKNPAETNPEPAVISNNKFWNATKHLFYSLIDFKFADGGWKKILLREFCLLCLIILLTSLLKRLPYAIIMDWEKILQASSSVKPMMGKNILFGHYVEFKEVSSKFLLALFIFYTLFQVRIFLYWRKKEYIQNLLSKWNFFDLKNGKWRSTLAKEVVYILFTGFTTIFLVSLIVICNYFFSYSQGQGQVQKADFFNARQMKDSLQEIYERPQDFTREYFGWRDVNGEFDYTDIGAAYDLISGRNCELPNDLYRNMEYSPFFRRLIWNIEIERDDIWIVNLQNTIRIEGGESFKNYELVKSFNSVNNLTIQKNNSLKASDLNDVSRLLYPYKFTSKYFILELIGNIDNDEWLSWFYENRVMKNQKFLDYLKDKGITDRFALRSYVKNKLYVSEHPYADYNNALIRYNSIQTKFDLLFENMRFKKLGKHNFNDAFLEIISITGMAILIILYPLRLIIIILKWIVDNSK